MNGGTRIPPRDDQWTRDEWNAAYEQAVRGRDWQTCDQLITEREVESWWLSPPLLDRLHSRFGCPTCWYYTALGKWTHRRRFRRAG